MPSGCTNQTSEDPAAHMSAEERNRRTRKVITTLGPVVIGGVLLLFLFNRTEFIRARDKGGGAYLVPDEGAIHVSTGTPIRYKHNPPSSGPHYPSPDAPKPWGAYREVITPGYFVHNLEHGGIVVLYTCSGAECNDIHSDMQSTYARLPRADHFGVNEVKFLSTSYSGPLPKKFALLAWDHELDANRLDFKTVAAFYARFVDRGLEDLP
jgi:uncharacterized protein DUF3105